MKRGFELSNEFHGKVDNIQEDFQFTNLPKRQKLIGEWCPGGAQNVDYCLNGMTDVSNQDIFTQRTISQHNQLQLQPNGALANIGHNHTPQIQVHNIKPYEKILPSKDVRSINQLQEHVKQKKSTKGQKTYQVEEIYVCHHPINAFFPGITYPSCPFP